MYKIKEQKLAKVRLAYQLVWQKVWAKVFRDLEIHLIRAENLQTKIFIKPAKD